MIRLKDNSTKVDSQFENNIRASLSKPSLYKHKMVRTEGETYFNHMYINRRSESNGNGTCFAEMPPTERQEENESVLKNNKISSQFSINILNSFTKNKTNKKQL